MTAPLRRIRPLAAALAAVLLGGAALFAVASPAAAHDELVSTDPAADSEVAALPDTLTLTFSGELLGGGDANEVQVTDATGATLNDGPAVVDGTTLTQAIAGEASGSIRVLWRVVSSDGHPISGEFSFTVAGTSTPAPSPSEATAAPSPTAAPTTSTAPTPTPEPADASEAANPLPWILGTIILVAVIALVLYLLVVRPRRRGPDSGTGTDR